MGDDRGKLALPIPQHFHDYLSGVTTHKLLGLLENKEIGFGCSEFKLQNLELNYKDVAKTLGVNSLISRNMTDMKITMSSGI